MRKLKQTGSEWHKSLLPPVCCMNIDLSLLTAAHIKHYTDLLSIFTLIYLVC